MLDEYYFLAFWHFLKFIWAVEFLVISFCGDTREGKSSPQKGGIPE